MKPEEVAIGVGIGAGAFTVGVLLSCQIRSCATEGGMEITLKKSLIPLMSILPPKFEGFVEVREHASGTLLFSSVWALMTSEGQITVKVPSLPFGLYSVSWGEINYAWGSAKDVWHNQNPTRVEFNIEPINVPAKPMGMMPRNPYVQV